MSRIHVDQDITPLSDFRTSSAHYIQQLQESKRPIILTQHGRSAAVLLDVKAYEELLDKLELLQEVQIAESQIKKGKVVSHIKAKASLLAKF